MTAPQTRNKNNTKKKSTEDRAGAAAADDVIRLARFLPYRLTLLAAHLGLTNADLQVGDRRLSLQEWKVMAIVADAGPVTPVGIRHRGTQDKSTISWAIRRMVDQGLLVRSPAPTDGRTFEVSMSEAGWAYYNTVVPKARARARAILGALDRAELDSFRRLVDKLMPS